MKLDAEDKRHMAVLLIVGACWAWTFRAYLEQRREIAALWRLMGGDAP